MKSLFFSSLVVVSLLCATIVSADRVVVVPLGSVTNVEASINWLGQWSEGVPYEHGDAIQYLGSTYLCLDNHTSTSSNSPPYSYWSLMAIKGERGEVGAEGPIGPSGATGPMGPMGPPGDAGPMGPIGTTGPMGPSGATGPIGPSGADGTDGMNCWDLNENLLCDLLSEDVDGNGSCGVSDCLTSRDLEICTLYNLVNITLPSTCQSYCSGENLPGFCSKKVIFVTSGAYNGNLGGLTGADAICQSEAEAQVLSGIFKAWLSDSSLSAKDRIAHSTGSAYITTGGKLVASGWDDLIDGHLKSTIGAGGYAWTYTKANGEMATGLGGSSCLDWTSSSYGRDGFYGLPSSTTLTWTEGGTGSSNIACDWEHRLYCIQQ